MKVRGELLKEARLKKGLSVEEVSESIKIRPQYLRAIEEGFLQDLPPGIIGKGFVKAYARFLGMDPKEVILEESQELPLLSLEEQRRPRSKRPGLMLGIALLVIGLLLALWVGRGRNPSKRPTAPYLQSLNQSAPEGLADIDVEDRTSQQALGGDEKPQETEGVVKVYTLELKAKELTWVRIKPKDKGNAYELLLQPGQSHLVESPVGFELKIGNAGGIEISLNGQPLPPLGRSGQVRTLSLP